MRRSPDGSRRWLSPERLVDLGAGLGDFLMPVTIRALTASWIVSIDVLGEMKAKVSWLLRRHRSTGRVRHPAIGHCQP